MDQKQCHTMEGNTGIIYPQSYKIKRKQNHLILSLRKDVYKNTLTELI